MVLRYMWCLGGRWCWWGVGAGVMEEEGLVIWEEGMSNDGRGGEDDDGHGDSGDGDGG